MNNEANKKIETDLNSSFENVAVNYADKENRTPVTSKINIKILGNISFGEEPIMENSNSYWHVCVIFDSNITEKMAEELIIKYNIPKPRSMNRTFLIPEYYISVSKSEFESVKKTLNEEEFSTLRMAKRIKITNNNVTSAVWGTYDEMLPILGSRGIQLRKTMVMALEYGPETPQTESKNIMDMLFKDEKVIDTTAEVSINCNCSSPVS